MHLRNSSLFWVSILAIGMMGCTHESVNPDPVNPVDPVVQEPPCDPNLVYFEQDVLPLLQSSCGYAGCHDVASAEDGVILVNYETVMGSKGGDLVSAGNPQNSELFEVLVEDDPDKLMPPPNEGGPLSQAQIDLIYTWIDQGALNNSCEGCDSTLASYSGAIEPMLSTNCTSCHSGANPDGGVDLTTHGGVVGAVSYSNLMACIRHEPGVEAMPPSGNQLTDCHIQQFQNWIDAGMPND